MHTTIDYSKSPTPSFDAVRDIIEWLGPDRYAKVNVEMSKVTDCHLFAIYCSLAGIKGYPVKAWYDHFHGQGSWKEPTND